MDGSTEQGTSKSDLISQPSGTYRFVGRRHHEKFSKNSDSSYLVVNKCESFLFLFLEWLPLAKAVLTHTLYEESYPTATEDKDDSHTS